MRRSALLPGERVTKKGDARCRWPRWLTSWGSLFLTDRRLVYTPSIFFLKEPFSIDLRDVTTVFEETGIWANLDMASRIAVVAGAKTYSFGFGIYGWKRRRAWVEEIRKAVSQNGGPLTVN